jgi:hypothetical protein
MKTKSLFIAALLVFGSAVAFAGKDEPRKTGFAVVPVKNSEIFKVIYRGESAGKVRLNIYNASGSLVLTETINGVDGFIVPVNFAGLNYGDYTIELVDAAGKKSEKVSYQSKRNVKSVHVGKLLNQENKFIVAVAANGADEISLKIYDQNNNIVHNETKNIAGDFAQVYKLDGASSSYTFEVTDKTGFIKTVKF